MLLKTIITFLLISFDVCVYSQLHSVTAPVSTNGMGKSEPDWIQDEIIIKFKDSYDFTYSTRNNKLIPQQETLNVIFSEYGFKQTEKVFPAFRKENRLSSVSIHGQIKKLKSLHNIYRFKTDSIEDMHILIEKLANITTIDYAEPNYHIYLNEIYPDDPIYQTGAQWHIDSVNAPKAYELNTSDTNQIIAILDTGIDWGHTDITDNIWINYNEIPDNGIDDDNNGYVDDRRGWDFCNSDNNPDDDNSHGTHVAGIAAASTNNSVGVAGIAWNARLMPLKILQSNGQGNSSDFANAIVYAYQNGATIINMSLGSYGESLTVKSALEYAYSSSTLIAATGNDFYNLDLSPMYPACYSFVIGVEATNYYGNLAEFSNFDIDGPVGSKHTDLYNYEIRSPGYGIYSTFPNGNYHALSGTSMSTPIVSGAVAMMKSYFGNISNEQLFVRLIQGANNRLLDIYNSMVINPTPDLVFLTEHILDTLSGCDNDNVADAGETIVLNIDLKNYGGYADSVYARIKLGQYEDTAVATVLDSTSYIGDLSAYASLHNNLNPFKIFIHPDVIHNRDIVFECIISAGNADTVTEQIIINVQNAYELSGVMDTTLSLTQDKLWLVNSSFRIGTNGHMILKPGTHIMLNAPVVNWGLVEAIGTEDSMITVYGPSVFDIGYYNLSYVHSLPGDNNSYSSFDNYSYSATSNAQCNVSNCIFDGAINFILHDANCSDCIFNNCGLNNWITDTIIRCNFDNVGYGLRLIHGYEYVAYCNFSAITNNHIIWGGSQFYKNNFVTNLSTLSYICQDGGMYYQIPPQYWGTTDTTVIDEMIWDFHDGFTTSAIVLYQPILSTPSDSAHGFAWKIHINGINPQNTNLDPLGVETARFDLFFNRAMDTLITPQLSFGVREPHNQYIVSDNSSWSNDSTIWTAYYDIDINTGDGINYLRVQDAVDNEGFEIPVENNKRFFFTIQAAGAQNISFTAIAGIGRSTLNWDKSAKNDIIGYNMYRFYNLTDTSFSDTSLINNTLITDTNFVDYDIIPDTTYHYIYKVVGTDLQESDYSKSVTCTPLPALTGDANCDNQIDVLDITTIVSYMLNQNPTPFLFDAADVNSDDNINVLDIIGCVQLINSSKSVPLSGIIDISNEPAYYTVKDNKLYIESNGSLAALQFEIRVNDPAGIERSRNAIEKEEKECHPERSRGKYLLNQLQMLSIQNSFEFAYTYTNNKITGILYSLNGNTLPDGDIPLFRLKGYDESVMEINNIFGGNLDGDYVPVLKKGQILEDIVPNEISLSAQPNPFTESTSIEYSIPEGSVVQLSIYDLEGRETACLVNTFQQTGNYKYHWQSHNLQRATCNLQPGIYLCRLKAHTPSGKQIEKVIKIIYTK